MNRSLPGVAQRSAGDDVAVRRLIARGFDADRHEDVLLRGDSQGVRGGGAKRAVVADRQSACNDSIWPPGSCFAIQCAAHASAGAVEAARGSAKMFAAGTSGTVAAT